MIECAFARRHRATLLHPGHPTGFLRSSNPGYTRVMWGNHAMIHSSPMPRRHLKKGTCHFCAPERSSHYVRTMVAFPSLHYLGIHELLDAPPVHNPGTHLGIADRTKGIPRMATPSFHVAHRLYNDDPTERHSQSHQKHLHQPVRRIGKIGGAIIISIMDLHLCSNLRSNSIR